LHVLDALYKEIILPQATSIDQGTTGLSVANSTSMPPVKSPTPAGD
jgi:hypothetical protein